LAETLERASELAREREREIDTDRSSAVLPAVVVVAARLRSRRADRAAQAAAVTFMTGWPARSSAIR